MKRIFVLFFLLVAATGWGVGSTSLDLGNTQIKKTLVSARTPAAITTTATLASFSFLDTICDRDGSFNGIASTTIKTSGNYRITLCFETTDASENAVWFFYIYKNGVQLSDRFVITANLINYPFGCTLDRIYAFASGDVISFQQQQFLGTGGEITGQFALEEIK